MQPSGTPLSEVAFRVQEGPVYQRLLIESGHITKNQWYLSERFGHPVDRSYAAWDWNMRHRDKWIKDSIAAGYDLPP